ncbi:mycofactocin biosynthesis glycosyltransferase MftF [Streptomyces turgidiscabies]|uniref:Mycofactocin system glycosyltransferase n=1 Tax=Streptomyces turgidiscabies (strain Car8) TaxID=698760 RepID=L7F2H8_STRT8|nr:mycofactocin biosynthesis glycosyltransferase MftF [Streptomyces turgidiscabies]ELP65171.1 mycofactocin system glycosyltransferase [Streptomyces turgidiscabies Car8]MDX3494583.1 mycofactocin biosynthesis glycosyltransferase MftF [Streptomyces turgidiscabies]GAQ71190.1 N-glycosyltransferase [Streptomyces turgidiscabies]
MTLPVGVGVVVAFDRHTRVVDGGRALVGGFPTRLLRLTPRARGLLVGRTVPVRDAASALLADRLVEGGMAHPVVDSLPTPPDPRYTVVIPVRDRPRQLDRLLRSINTGGTGSTGGRGSAGGSGRTGPPVIVVDDASRHPLAVAAVAARHGARLVALDTNTGPAGARNAGLRHVTTPYVVFADSDIVLDPGTVPTLLRHFADPRVAMAVPRITGLTGHTATWIERYENTRSSLDLGAHPAPVRPGTPVSWAPTACAVARVDALREVRGFDEGMRVGEDVDLCWRLIEAGLRVRYEPAVRASHEHRVRLGDWFLRKAVYGTGAHPLALRHPEFIAPAVFAPWSVLFTAGLLAGRRWSAPVAGAVLGVVTLRIGRKFDGTRHPYRLAVPLAGNGALATLAQTSALLTRHWWPLTAVGCLVSRRIRRAAAVAALADIALEYRPGDPGGAALDPFRYGVARRLDDLAYGAGVWFSALKGRSTAALRPRVTRGKPASPGQRKEPSGPRGASRH